MSEPFRNRPADLHLAIFELWIDGRQFEDLQDYWDGNWLSVRARCRTEGSEVWACGPILHLPELVRFRDELRELDNSLSGVAQLECMEPNLHIRVELQRGRGTLRVSITPEHLTESHEFTAEIDQSYLRETLTQLHRILQKYPVRGKLEDY
jgi:hypothetical protein